MPAARPLTSCARLPRTQVREPPQRNDKKKKKERKFSNKWKGKKRGKVRCGPDPRMEEQKEEWEKKRRGLGSIKKEENGNRLWSGILQF